jgi:CBS domain-containing protein
MNAGQDGREMTTDDGQTDLAATAATMAEEEALIRARDLMVPTGKYPAVTVDDSLAHAARVLSDWHIDMRGSVSMPRILLVMTADGHLAGVIRRRDILRGLAPSFLVGAISDHPEMMFDVEVDPNLTELLSHRAAEKLREKASTRVGEIADPIPATVHPDDPLIRVIQEMVRHDQSLLPVVEDDHVIGAVRTVEVLKTVSDMLSAEDRDGGGA